MFTGVLERYFRKCIRNTQLDHVYEIKAYGHTHLDFVLIHKQKLPTEHYLTLTEKLSYNTVVLCSV